MDIKEKIQAIIDKYEDVFDHGYRPHPKHLLKDLKSLLEWEPKEHDYPLVIMPDGEIVSGSGDYATRLMGGEWSNTGIAVKARDMNKRNQLILQAKHEMGYGDGRYKIFFNKHCNVWLTSAGYHTANPELCFETKEQAEHVIEMVGLNET